MADFFDFPPTMENSTNNTPPDDPKAHHYRHGLPSDTHHYHSFGPSPSTNHPSTNINHPPGSTSGRPYKSRSRRPCDFCRRKRAACLLAAAPPCELCARFGRECTFVERPVKRRRVGAAEDYGEGFEAFGGAQEEVDGRYCGEGEVFVGDAGERDGVGRVQRTPESGDGGEGSGFGSGSGSSDPGSGSGPRRRSRTQQGNGFAESGPELGLFDYANVEGSGGGAAHPGHDYLYQITSPSPEPPSLDADSACNAQVVGLSGESDPYLLALYRYGAGDECAFQQLRVRDMGVSEGVPVQFMVQANALASRAQPGKFGKSVEELREEVEGMVGEEVGGRLIRLFFKYIQPYFPVLSHERIVHASSAYSPSSIDTCLLAAIYGHALPFTIYDDQLCVQVYTPPSSDTLFNIAWQASLPKFHTPSLSVIQTLLLLLQRRPTNRHVADTPYKWALMAECVALAQALGLNMDPGAWPLPAWEKRLRRRVAWAVFVQDKWLSFNFGRSSHIQSEDWDVAPLGKADFGSAGRMFEDDDDGSDHFLRLASLTGIVARIHSNLFSIKATRALSTSLEATFEAAKPLRICLAQWSQNHASAAVATVPSTTYSTPSSLTTPQDLDGSGSLRLAYITAKISVFRALLRPQIHEAAPEARTALRTGAMAVAREVYDFLAGLEANHLEAFWHSYSRVNFAIASNFMVLLFASSPTLVDATESLALLDRWRSLLRIKSRSCDLLNLSLLRLDAMYVAGLDSLIELSPAAAQAFRERG